jgi:hypothetical protein
LGERARRVLAKALEAVSEIAREETGRAMAAIFLNKPRYEVTKEEALDALIRSHTEADLELENRALRAGARAVITKLAGDLYPPLFPRLVAATLVAALYGADAGERRCLGTMTPSKTGRRGFPAQEAEYERVVATEVAFKQGRRQISMDAAIESVTGVARGDLKPRKKPAMLPMTGSWDTVRRRIERAGKDNPGLVEAARLEGEARRRGEPMTPSFLAFRKQYLLEAFLRRRAEKASKTKG